MGRLAILSVLSIMMFTCCTKESKEQQKRDDIIELRLLGSAPVITKADSLLKEGLSIGIYVPLKDTLITKTGVKFSNRLYRSVQSGTLSGGPVYLTAGNDYDIYGYSPYKQDVLSAETISGFVNGDDVLLSDKTGITNASVTNCSSTLIFNHLVSQISFNVVCADPAMTLNATSSLEITGFYNEAILNLVKSSLTPKGSASPVTVSGSNGSLAIKPFCFFTSNPEAMNLYVKAKIEGIQYNGTITKVFVPGESYNYTVTIPVTTHQLQFGATLTSWVEKDEEISIGN